MPPSAPMLLRLLSVAACAMTANAFASTKRVGTDLLGSVAVKTEDVGTGCDNVKTGCCCTVNIAPNSLFSNSMLTPGNIWLTRAAYTAFTVDYEKCFEVGAPEYAKCQGPADLDAFKKMACGNYDETTPANNVAPRSGSTGFNYFQALTFRLADETNAVIASFNGGPADQVSSYDFCTGFEASGGFPPAPPGSVYSNFACNKLIDINLFEEAWNAKEKDCFDDTADCWDSLQMDDSYSNPTCGPFLLSVWSRRAKTMADKGTMCSNLWQNQDVNGYTGVRFCSMSPNSDGTKMTCQFTPPYITEGCFTSRAPAAPPLR